MPTNVSELRHRSADTEKITINLGFVNLGQIDLMVKDGFYSKEIDIWRVAVLMVKRHADDAEANANRRADELETEGDQAGAAVWRRVTLAIEQLKDLTGTLH